MYECKCRGCCDFAKATPKPEMLSHSEAAGWSSLYPMSQRLQLQAWEERQREHCLLKR
jgi:hypothetical protein